MLTQNGRLGRRRALADAVAGVAGSVVALWTFYPIEVWKTNAQAGSCSKQKPLFHGCGIKTLHTASSSFCYFFLYSWIFSAWTHNEPKKKVSTMARLILSAVAAMLNTMLTLPLDVMSSKLLTEDDKQSNQDPMNAVWDELAEGDSFYPASEEEEDLFMAELLEEEKRDESLATIPENKHVLPPLEEEADDHLALWKGLIPSLLLCCNPSINYTVFDMAKNGILARRHSSKLNLSMMDAFLLGLFAKFVATMATYPVIRAKVMLMVTSEKSMVAVLCRSYKEHGVRGLYKGCNWQLIHTVLKSALMMMVREKITAGTQRVIVGDLQNYAD
jgi:phosphatidylglycerophosphatase A